MGILITRFNDEQIAAVRQFNLRLGAAGAEEFRFPEQPASAQAPVQNHGIQEERFVAVEDGTVRGAYILRRQRFSFEGAIQTIAHYRHPISEGLADKTYTGVALQMLRTALKTEPLLFALGMGSEERPLPRMLKAIGWSLYTVPFHFKVNRPYRLLRRLPALRQSAPRKLAMDLAALTGAGWLGFRALQALPARRCPPISVEIFHGFGGWADELWQHSKHRYAMVAVRDRATLNFLYPAADERFLCLRVSDSDAVLGWAVVLDSQMRAHKQFGDLRVGTIVDCLALPENACQVMAAATRFLEGRGVDLLISNQSHETWSAALRKSGFLPGPSNFIFAASKKLAELLAPFAVNARQMHINRGDGDGPIHL